MPLAFGDDQPLEGPFEGTRADMLSQKAKYAIKALLELARLKEGELLQSNEIARRQNIPKKFLDLIFFDLRGHGIVHSVRGRDGGFALNLPPADISIARIVRAMDGPLAPLPCASVTAYRRCADCKSEKTCEVRKMMREVRDAAAAILDNTSLAEAAALNERKARPRKLAIR